MHDIERQAYRRAFQELRRLADQAQDEAFSLPHDTPDLVKIFGRLKGLREAEQRLWDLMQCH